jgi:hypothetical protein
MKSDDRPARAIQNVIHMRCARSGPPLEPPTVVDERGDAYGSRDGRQERVAADRWSCHCRAKGSLTQNSAVGDGPPATKMLGLHTVARVEPLADEIGLLRSEHITITRVHKTSYSCLPRSSAAARSWPGTKMRIVPHTRQAPTSWH